jgi:hypothetical protein
MGKTRLVGTAARIAEVENIYWFDLENGSETLLNMGLTEEEMGKITIFKVRDTKDNPIGVETVLKALSSKPISICDAHGRVACALCSKNKASFTEWDLTKCTHNDLVVIDSGTQLGESAMAAACLGQDVLFKPGFDEFGIQGKYLSDVLSVIQQATFTNFIVICHTLVNEDDDGKDKFFPLMGTKPYSMRVAGKFGTVIYCDKKMNAHVAGSSSTYRSNVVTGSRLNVSIEKSKDMSMRDVLVAGGVLKPGSHSSPTTIASTIPLGTTTGNIQMEQVVEVGVGAAPIGLAARLAANKAASLAKKNLTP